MASSTQQGQASRLTQTNQLKPWSMGAHIQHTCNITIPSTVAFEARAGLTQFSWRESTVCRNVQRPGAVPQRTAFHGIDHIKELHCFGIDLPYLTLLRWMGRRAPRYACSKEIPFTFWLVKLYGRREDVNLELTPGEVLTPTQDRPFALQGYDDYSWMSKGKGSGKDFGKAPRH